MRAASTHTQRLKRSVWLALAAFALLTAAVGMVLWSDSRQQAARAVADDQVQRIRIQRPGFTDMALHRQGDDWLINEPCALPANAHRVQPLLQALRPAAHSYAAGEVDREAAGLLQPAAILILDDTTLRLGSTDLSGQRRYVQRGERVEFVPEWALSMVDGGLSALASLQVFPDGLDEMAVQAEPVTDPAAEQVPAAVAVPLDEAVVAQYRTLTAQQIVAWPLPETGGPESDTAGVSYRLIARNAGADFALTRIDFPAFTAIRYANAGCAYIIATSSLPAPVPVPAILPEPLAD